jgi:hypothetical protein
MIDHALKRPLLMLGTLLVLTPATLLAQELPRPSLTHAAEKHTLPTDYNMKLGPVYFNLNSSLEADYVDNIGLTSSNTQSDFLLTPELGITASWPVTESNDLTLSTSLGYTKYLIHPQYDTSHLLVAPDSRLSFNIYSGNFKINLHDDFSYQQDPVNEAQLSNIVTFDRFENIAGIGVVWDLNKVVANLNYDHINFLSTGLQAAGGADLPNADALDYTADQVSGMVEAHLSSTLVGGIDAAASSRTYDHYDGSYNTISAGPFFRAQITQHIQAELSGGYKYIEAPDTFLPNTAFGSGTLQPGSSTGNHDSYYVDLTLNHEVNKYFLQRLSVGHDLELGILADQSDETYARYTSSWHVNTKLNLALTASYQHVEELGSPLTLSSYDSVGVALQANFPVTKSISGAFLYQFTDKLANSSDQGYLQNKLGLILNYHF